AAGGASAASPAPAAFGPVPAAAANSAGKLASSAAALLVPGPAVGAPAPRSACRMAETSIVESPGASAVPRHRSRATGTSSRPAGKVRPAAAQMAGLRRPALYDPAARALV